MKQPRIWLWRQSVAPLISIAVKDIKILLRDRSALVFLFGLPLVFTPIFGTIYGGRGRNSSPEIKLLVVNLDSGKHGNELLEAIRKAGLTLETESQGPDKLRKRVQSGDQAIGIVIPSDYSRRLDAAVQAGMD